MHWILIAVSAVHGFSVTFDDRPACEMAAERFVQEHRSKATGSPFAFCAPSSSANQKSP